jgi:predicted nucleic acid-binding protein
VNYLADTSALVRILRRQVDARWDDLVERGLVALCEPVLVEALTIADAKRYDQVEHEIRETYPWVPVPDDVWDLVRGVRRDLATHSQHQGLSIADYLVIGTAIRLKLVVLHEDADFETVSRIVPQLRQERLSAQS